MVNWGNHKSRLAFDAAVISFRLDWRITQQIPNPKLRRLNPDSYAWGLLSKRAAAMRTIHFRIGCVVTSRSGLIGARSESGSLNHHAKHTFAVSKIPRSSL